ncbi:MAG: phage tail tape measure protein [Lachnospiraceae bacterium]|nr:phage tail tape measure protein [Lachnospiraceae bacterium]
MAGDIKGITIEFRGDTTKLDKALRQIDSETKTVNDELKKVNGNLKFNPTNIELWRQKQQLLTQKIKETEERLNVLKDAQKNMDASKVDENSEEYRKLRREIIETESKLKTFKQQLKEIGNVNLRALSEGFKKVGDKLTDAGKKLSRLSAGIVAAYTAAAKLGSDYEENLNKIDVAFGDSADAVKAWANTTRDAFGMSKVQATESAAAFGALAKGVGFAEESAADMSTTLAGLSADLGSYFNVEVEEAAGALEGIFTGNAVALKRFGVVMNDVNLKAFAEQQGLVWKELDQTQKTMVRYQYVLEATKDAQGDFARTSSGLANSSKVFKAALQDLATSIGTVLIPIITPLIQKAAELINKFNDLSPQMQKAITIIGLIVAAAGPLLLVLGSVSKAIGAVIGVIGMLNAPIAIAIAAIAALVAIGITLYKNWDTIKAKAKSAWNEIYKAIVVPMKAAVAYVQNAIASIKKLFSGTLSFPHIKLPHFRITGSFSLSPPSVPRIGVEWYAKGGIFTQPTIFGGIGVGEAGAEAVLPIERLREMVDFGNAEGNALLAQMVQLLTAMNLNMTASFKEALRGMKVELDDDEVGRFVEATVAKAIYT